MHCQFADPYFSNHYTKVLIAFRLHQPRFYCLSSRDFVSDLCILYGIVKRLLVILKLTLGKPIELVAGDLRLEQELFGR